MNTTTSNAKITSSDLFHPIEHAFICDWLGVQRPADAKNIDLYDERKDGQPEELDIIRPIEGLEGWDGNLGDPSSNAVARLVLSNIQGRLPQWAAVYHDGKITLARKRGTVRQHPISLMPQYLFTINWADSGPGYSWPEAYYATYLPYYDIYVVTLSQDSPDAYGYTDLAIGYFKPVESILEGAHRLITENWSCQLGEYDQSRWAYLFGTGLVDEEIAQRWSDEVWGNDELDDDRDEEGSE